VLCRDKITEKLKQCEWKRVGRESVLAQLATAAWSASSRPDVVERGCPLATELAVLVRIASVPFGCYCVASSAINFGRLGETVLYCTVL
jgi:hypothetical protein